MEWLVSDWQFFGLHGQVWMALFAAGLALYIAVLIAVNRRGTRSR